MRTIWDCEVRWEDMVEKNDQHLEEGIQTTVNCVVWMTGPFSNGARMIGARAWGGRRGI